MIILCTLPFDVIYANMKSEGSGRGVTAELNGLANFGPLGLFWLRKIARLQDRNANSVTTYVFEQVGIG